MTDENKVETPGVEDSTADFINTINELKANTVPKDAYEKIKEENRQLLNSLVNNAPIEKAAEPVDTQKEIEKQRNILFGDFDVSNLAYADAALKLRTLVMENGGADIFLPTGTNIAPTEEDFRTAQRVADGLQHCVDYAQGDNEAFTNELQRITVDTGPKKYR